MYSTMITLISSCALYNTLVSFDVLVEKRGWVNLSHGSAQLQKQCASFRKPGHYPDVVFIIAYFPFLC